MESPRMSGRLSLEEEDPLETFSVDMLDWRMVAPSMPVARLAETALIAELESVAATALTVDTTMIEPIFILVNLRMFWQVVSVFFNE
jgi:hypothetical protein